MVCGLLNSKFVIKYWEFKIFEEIECAGKLFGVVFI